MLTLAQWWESLDTETRALANLLSIAYPAARISHAEVTLENLRTPWDITYNTVCLGMAIEENMFIAKNIAANIARLQQQLTGKVPHSDHYFPGITDEHTLLLALVYYRAQSRFQNINSSSWLINTNLPKAETAETAVYVAAQIKAYCAANPEIAATAREKFKTLFRETEGFDLLQSKTLAQQFTGYTNTVITRIVSSANGLNYNLFKQNVQATVNAVNTELQTVGILLKRLYLLKKMQAYILNDRPNIKNLALFLQENQPHFQDIEDEARNLWQGVQKYVYTQYNWYEKVAQQVTQHNLASLAQDYSPIMSQANVGKFIQHSNHYFAKQIHHISNSISNATDIKPAEFKHANLDDIANLLQINNTLKIEISLLQKSLAVYENELVTDDMYINFSITFFNWINQFMAQYRWTSSILHDNIHYLSLAKNLNQRLGGLNPYENQTGAVLQELKVETQNQILAIQRQSCFLFFKGKRESAQTHFTEIITTEPNRHRR